MTTTEIVLSHGDKTEATCFPFWAIVKKCGLGRNEFLDGIWFNREDATKYLNAKRYRYGDKAFVYCFSGNASWHLREIFENAGKESQSVEVVE